MQNLFPNQAPAQFRYLSGPSATVLATVTVSATRLDWFFRGVYPLDLGDQPIAPAGHGLDIFRLFRGVAESSTQRSNGNIDGVVEVDCRVAGRCEGTMAIDGANRQRAWIEGEWPKG